MQSIEGRKQQFAIMSIGSLNGEGEWKPTAITQHAPFGSLFAAISGSGTDGGMTRKGL